MHNGFNECNCRQKSILLELLPDKPEITDKVIANIDKDPEGVGGRIHSNPSVPKQYLHTDIGSMVELLGLSCRPGWNFGSGVAIESH